MSELFNPWTLPRPEIREDEREYSDPRHPGVSVRLRFRELNPFSEGQSYRLYGEYYERFVKPKVTEKGKEPSPQLLPTPVPILLNEITLDDMVLLQAMHVPPDGSPKYGLLEWAGFAANMPDAYRDMVRVCKELNRGLEQDSGNRETPEPGSGEQSSNPLSTSDSPILNSCFTSVEHSEASPEACEPSASDSESPMGTAERIPEPSTSAFSETSLL